MRQRFSAPVTGTWFPFSRFISCFLVSVFILTSCSFPPTGSHKTGTTATTNGDSSKPFSTKSQLEEALDALPYKPDPRNQIVIVAQDNNEPIRISTKREIPQNLAVEHKDYSFTPSMLQKVTQGEITTNEADALKAQTLDAFNTKFREFSLQVWEMLIQQQHEAKEAAQRDHQQQLSTLSSSQSRQLQKEYELARREREVIFEKQRAALQEAFTRAQLEIIQKISEKFSKAGDFSTQDCVAWFPLSCVGDVIITGLGYIGQAVATVSAGDAYTQEIAKVADTKVNEFKNNLWFIGISGTPAPPSPAPTTNIYTNIQTTELFAESSNVSVDTEDAAKAKSEMDQRVVSNPNTIPKLPANKIISDTLRYLYSMNSLRAKGRMGYFNIPIFFSDIMKDADITVNVSNYNACKELRESSGGIVTDLSKLYEEGQQGEYYSNCDLVTDNIFYSFDTALSNIKNTISYFFNLNPIAVDLALSDPELLPSYLKNDAVRYALERARREIEIKIAAYGSNPTGQTFPSGQIILEQAATDLQNVFGVQQFANTSDDGTTTSLEWLRNSIQRYYPDFYNNNTTEIENKLTAYVNGRRFALRIISPDRCARNIYEVEADKGFGQHGYGAVVWKQASENFVFDGGYTFEFGYYNSSNDWHAVVSVKDVPVADLLGLSVDRLRSNNYNPLSMTDIRDPRWSSSLEHGLRDFEIDTIGLQIRNKTSNYWDLKVTSVGNPDCPAAFEAYCLPYNESSFRLNHRNYRNGVYRVSTQYSRSKVKDYQYDTNQPWFNSGVDTNGNFYGDNSNRFQRGESYAYRFVSLHVNYATFAHIAKKPAHTTLTTQFDPASAVTRVSGVEGSSNYYPPEDAKEYIPDPPQLARPSQGDLPAANSKQSTSVVKEILQYANYAQSGSAGQNLLVDLIQPHPNNTPSSAYDAFGHVQVKQCEKNAFVQVGAVVNLTNQDRLNNHELFQHNQYVPMRLVIKKSGDSQILRSWGFMAKVGSNTFVEEYWDGKPMDARTGVGTRQTPQYLNGDYTISVEVDYGRLNADYLLSMSKKDKYNAYVAPPIVLNTSTNATLSIDRSVCAPSVEVTETKVLSNGALLLRGNSNLSEDVARQLKPNFSGDLTVRDYTLKRAGNTFEILIKDYQLTPQYFKKLAQLRSGFSSTFPQLLAYASPCVKDGFQTASEDFCLAFGPNNVQPESLDSGGILNENNGKILNELSKGTDFSPLGQERLKAIKFVMVFSNYVPLSKRDLVIEAINVAKTVEEVRFRVEGFREYLFLSSENDAIAARTAIFTLDFATNFAVDAIKEFYLPPDPRQHPYLFTLYVVTTVLGLAPTFKGVSRLPQLLDEFPILKNLENKILLETKCGFYAIINSLEDFGTESLSFSTLADDPCKQLGSHLETGIGGIDKTVELARKGVFFTKVDSAFSNASDGLKVQIKRNNQKYAKDIADDIGEAVRAPERFIHKPSFKNAKAYLDGLELEKFDGLGQHLIVEGRKRYQKAATTGLKIRPTSAMPNFSEHSLLDVDFSRISDSAKKLIESRHDKIDWKKQWQVNNGLKFGLDEVDHAVADVIASEFFKQKGLIPQDTSPLAAAKLVERYRSELQLTWHHVEDLKTMQLIPSGIHDANKHIGGNAVTAALPNSGITRLEWVAFTGLDTPSYYFNN